MIAYAQDFCEDLYALVGVHPKRKHTNYSLYSLLFESIQKDMEGDKLILTLNSYPRVRADPMFLFFYVFYVCI